MRSTVARERDTDNCPKEAAKVTAVVVRDVCRDPSRLQAAIMMISKAFHAGTGSGLPPVESKADLGTDSLAMAPV